MLACPRGPLVSSTTCDAAACCPAGSRGSSSAGQAAATAQPRRSSGPGLATGLPTEERRSVPNLAALHSFLPGPAPLHDSCDLGEPDSGEETPMVGAGQQQSRVVRIVSKQSNV